MASNTTMTSGIADRYSAALFELALEHQALDAIERDFGNLRQMLADSDELQRLIKSPLVGSVDQTNAMTAIGERADFNDLTVKFLGLLAANRRLFALPAMIDAFALKLAHHRGEVKCEVTSAIPLTDKQVKSLKSHMATYVGKDVNLDLHVDPSRLGGLVVRVGSRMIDASLVTKLRTLEHSMRGIG